MYSEGKIIQQLVRDIYAQWCQMFVRRRVKIDVPLSQF